MAAHIIRVRLRPGQTEPFLIREGLSFTKIYEIDLRHNVVAFGDAKVYYINGKAYSALRFEIVG
jgi:hypothetical protein